MADPRHPVRLTATTVEESESGYQVSFTPAAPDTDYLAVQLSSAHEPVALVPDSPSFLRTAENSADYLIITPLSLLEGSNALAAYHTSQGRQTKIVELEDIYDEFNGGIEDPSAIRDFLAYVHSNWQTIPAFVALVGKGTLDPKDIWGLSTNVMPLILARTPYGLFGSDNKYADVTGEDSVPEFAIGRIPVLSSEDLVAYVNKLEQLKDSSGSWRSSALFLADSPDNAGDFHEDSADIADVLPGNISVTAINYASGTDPAETRNETVQILNNGVSLFNYLGHGSPTQLGKRGLLRSSDGSLLQNNDRLPLFLTMTCYTGNGTIPGLDSLAGQLTLMPEGGVSASLAPTGMSVNSQARLLNKLFIQALYKEDITMGEALNTALQEFKDQGGAEFIRAIYGITGDPAVTVY